MARRAWRGAAVLAALAALAAGCGKSPEAAGGGAATPAVWQELSTVPGVSLRRMPGGQGGQTITVTDLELAARNAGLLDVLAYARGGGEDCFDPESLLPEGSYDVTVRIDAEAARSGKASVWDALTAAYAKAFAVRIGRDKREVDVRVLSRAAPQNRGPTPAQDGEPWSVRTEGGGYALAAFTMDDLADFLARKFGGPVVNETGLEGAYTFLLEADPASAAPPVDGLGKAGLDLVAGRRAVEAVFVDRAEAEAAPCTAAR